jgi:hypothetical protein
MNLAEIERVRFTTRYFKELQGLKTLVPWGLCLVGFGVIAMVPAMPWRFPWGIAANLLTVVLACALFVAWIFAYFLAAAYYRRNFGDLEEGTWRPLQASTRTLVGFTLLGLALVLLLMALQAVYGVPLTTVLSGSYLIFFWVKTGRRLALVDHLLLGLLLLGYVTPAASGAFAPAIRLGKGIPEIVAGFAMVVAGLLDHLRLVRQMPLPRTPALAAEPSPARRMER